MQVAGTAALMARLSQADSSQMACAKQAALGDAWQVVPTGGNPAFRFFTVEVALP